jgi:hypothetical protein
VFNGNTDFSNPGGYDFKIGQNSAAKTLGEYNIVFPTYQTILDKDINNVPRTSSGSISAGAHQFQ